MSWLVTSLIQETSKGEGSVTVSNDAITTARTPSTTTRQLPARTTTTQLPARSTTTLLPNRTTTTVVPTKTTSVAVPQKVTTQQETPGLQSTNETNAQTTVQTAHEDSGFKVTFRLRIRGGLNGGSSTPLCQP